MSDREFWQRLVIAGTTYGLRSSSAIERANELLKEYKQKAF